MLCAAESLTDISLLPLGHAVPTKKGRAHNRGCLYNTSEYNNVPNNKGQIGFRGRGGYEQAISAFRVMDL